MSARRAPQSAPAPGGVRAPRRRGALSVLVVGAVVTALGVLVAPAASAHDQLVGTDPADGSTVASAPDHVTLTFEDPAVAIGTVVEVTGPDGSVVSDGAPQLVDSDVTQAITAQDLPAGTYTVTWRVTSPDGHVVSGDFAFTAKSASGDEASAPSSAVPSDEPSASPSSGDASSSDDIAGAPLASPTTSTAAGSSSSPGSGSGPVVWLVVGVGLLIGVAFGLLGWWRGRRRTATGTAATGTGATGDTDTDGRV